MTKCLYQFFSKVVRGMDRWTDRQKERQRARARTHNTHTHTDLHHLIINIVISHAYFLS